MINSTILKIENRHGAVLSASIEFPANQKASHIAIFAHCFTCNSSLHVVKHISRSLTTAGFAVVRFDFTGLGKSEGNFADSHFGANIQDLEDVHTYIAEKYFAPELIIGHSLGGAAAIVAASVIPDLKAVCTIGAPSDIVHTTKHFKDQVDTSSAEGESDVTIGGRTFAINEKFVEGFTKHDLPEIIKSLSKPILVLHSPIDEMVSISHAQTIYQNAMHPKSYVSLDKANHLLTKEDDSVYAGEVIATWVRKYLPREAVEAKQLHDHELVATLNTLEDKFTTSINSADHGLIADEPLSFGGNNYGMAPYELVTAGLAACTVMTINLYAKRKKWALEEVTVFMSHDKEQRDGERIDVFKKELVFKGDLDEEQKQRLTEIASKCPVHKSLTNGSLIETVYQDA